MSSKIPKGKNQVGSILRSSANALKGNKSPLGEYFRKIQARNGYIPAIVTTANKLSRIMYTLVKNKIEFRETFISIDEQERLKRKLIRTQKELERIQNQINRCA